MSNVRALLATATVLAGLAGVMPAQADDTLTSPRVPPDPTFDQVESNVRIPTKAATYSNLIAATIPI
jgi:hypothetical protein